ncbi:Arginyl-tRNA synthetase [Nucleospora cyclopteri]
MFELKMISLIKISFLLPMITFKKIVDQVVDLLVKNSKFTREEIEKLLIKTNSDKKKDFVIFFGSLTDKPEEIALEIKKSLENINQRIITDIEASKTSLSFNLNKKEFFGEILKTIIEKENSFGSNQIGNGETVVLDYSSPNIAKIFHVGHFRTTILGNFIKNLFNFSGYKTVSINHLGDWGKQFGLVLLGYEKYGSAEELEKDPLMHLFHVYVKISKEKEIHDEAKEIFRKMEEENDEKYMKQWNYFREISIKKYKELYKLLNVEFDSYSGESFYNESAKEFLKTTNLAKADEDGSKYVDCGKLGNALISKSDGTTLYLTRDICAVIYRMQTYNPSKIIYVVSSEQELHFKQLFCIAEKLGYDKKIFKHVNFGLVKGMSTREGKVHFIEDVIEIATNVMHDFIKDKNNIVDKQTVALTLAISFLLVCDFSAKRVKGYTFNIEQRAKTEKGQAIGPNLQYTHCRLVSIERKNDENNSIDYKTINYDLIAEKCVEDLMYKLLWFEHVVELCLNDYEPSRLVFYLQDLCSSINSIINILKVKDADKDVAEARLAVFKSARIVLHNGIKLLGINPLFRM